jgi:hypothetical protein
MNTHNICLACFGTVGAPLPLDLDSPQLSVGPTGRQVSQRKVAPEWTAADCC